MTLSRFRFLPLCLLLPALAFGQNREVLGEYKIGIVGRDSEAAIYQAAQLGAQDAARALSEQYSIDVELLLATPSPSQGGSQPTSLAELFVEDADGFLISPNAQAAVATTLRFAREQAQEVVFFESDLPDTDPLMAILADEEAAGRLAAEAMLAELPSRGRVAILTSTSPSPQLEDRLRGVRERLGYRRIERVVTTAPDYHAAIRAIEAAEEADRNDLITGWIFLEDWPLKGMPALPWEPGDKPVVAIQSSPSAFLYTDQGYVDALVVHPYYQWGYLGVEALVTKLHKGESPPERLRQTEPKLVDWRNFDAYRENWKSWFR